MNVELRGTVVTVIDGIETITVEPQMWYDQPAVLVRHYNQFGVQGYYHVPAGPDDDEHEVYKNCKYLEGIACVTHWWPGDE